MIEQSKKEDKTRAIDVHCHMSTLKGRIPIKDEELEAYEKYYRMKRPAKTEEEMAKEFIDLDIKALIMAWDSETYRGTPVISNAYVAQLVKDFPDAFLGGWAVIDPWKGKMAIKELERAVKGLGLLGLALQPIAQGFYPNNQQFYPLYEKCAELKIPLAFNSGTTGVGAGILGGSGYHLKYGKPIPYIDDLAADFPQLTIIMVHPAWPWHEEQIAILLHKANVCADLSGWAPKYFPESLKREINGRLQDKFMFGSLYPEVHPKRWLEEFEAGGYKSEVVEKVLYKNAQRVLKVGL